MSTGRTTVSTEHSVTMWPKGASEEYVAARVELDRAEHALHAEVHRLAALRRDMPQGPLLDDYEFEEGPLDLGLTEPLTKTTLLDLFGDHDTLFVYHMMFHPGEEQVCPMCSLWVDGFHGVSRHILRHAAFAVIAKAPVPEIRRWANRRGWDGIRFLSSHATTFNTDVGAETDTGDQLPMASVFRREGTRVRHFYTQRANFMDDAEGGFDQLSPVWHILDLLPTGRGDWYAENGYAGRLRGNLAP
ncbi:DUF899 family protein [Actinokineospora cianjurensis]|uniref:Putative dithiol-disulfide oxidoreductase (DUF899 family) n=1 Tax=Actinokineospora cianjurensis TaxID=585224 RepID=A0A421B169_9PSEU|nr:DUF899 family protein [Actinokineospora cianjurensis]RLK58078.1 putative dithiol-disulfide oxidoreductase (DUF899 family) [Actinokineospora cianjurensis]